MAKFVTLGEWTIDLERVAAIHVEWARGTEGKRLPVVTVYIVGAGEIKLPVMGGASMRFLETAAKELGLPEWQAPEMGEQATRSVSV